MVKAASLVYAIFISLLIGILCYAIVLMYSLNLSLNDHFDVRERLLEHNQSALSYLAANYNHIASNTKEVLFSEEPKIITQFNYSTWGVFKKWEVISSSKKESVRVDFITAYKRDKESPAIYVRDNDKEFKIAGKTRIEGDAYISSRGLKKTTISGNSGLFEPVHVGKVLTSEKELPKIELFKLEYPEKYTLKMLAEIREETFINTFDKSTIVIEVGTKLENIHLKGNIIVRSKDTLHIFENSSLEDVLIDAPKIIFHNGFLGNVQVFAQSEIILEPNVKLNYPSVLAITSEEDIEKRIVCGENSEVKGAILLTGNGLLTEDKNTVVVEPGASIIGDIYCDGKISLYGSVTGSVYASSFFHKTPSTQYDNLIFNAQILANKVPVDLFQLFTVNNRLVEEPVFIKKL